MKEKDSNELDVNEDDKECEEPDENEQIFLDSTQLSSEDAELEEKPKKITKLIIRFFALLISIVFIISILGSIFSNLNIYSIKLLTKSIELSREPKIKEWKKTVAMVSSPNGSGTGFNISAKGVVVTNNHVVNDASNLYINFPIKSSYKAEKWDTYPGVDLAIIKLENNSNLPFLNIESEIEPKAGDEVTVIGNPLRFFNVVSVGKVVGYTKLSNFDIPILVIQVPIYKGSSGSPVINEKGNVIGIIFATAEHSNPDEKDIIGYAIPSKEILLRIK